MNLFMQLLKTQKDKDWRARNITKFITSISENAIKHATPHRLVHKNSLFFSTHPSPHSHLHPTPVLLVHIGMLPKVKITISK